MIRGHDTSIIFLRLLFCELLYNICKQILYFPSMVDGKDSKPKEGNVYMEKQRFELMPNVFLTVLHTEKFRTNCLSVNLLRPLREKEAAENALLDRKSVV